MLTQPLLLLGALAAGGAVAQLPGAGTPGPALQARVLDDLDASPTCASARDDVLSLYAQLPTPAAVLDDAALPTGLCDEASLTGETAAAWSSYTSAALAVLASHTAVVASAFSACPDLLGRLPQVTACAGATAAPAPTGAAATRTGSAAATDATGTQAGPTATEAGAASSPSPDQNAAPRLGAVAGTLWAAAGLVGAVAAL